MDEKLKKVEDLAREYAFIRRLQNENECEIMVKPEMHCMLLKNENTLTELDRVRRA